MSISRRSSNASAPCRLEWRPSRWLVSALAMLGVLGACSTLMSEMPRPLAWMLATAALLGGGWSALREARRSRCQLAWLADGSLVADGARVHAACLQWRGPLAFLRWRDGQGAGRSLTWWPDTLDVRARRELRLAHARAVSAASSPSMAP